jgi:pyridoxamine 5'-phosphate oxidase family protein
VDLTRRETWRLAGSRAVFYGESVSVFSAAEIAYLECMTMGRLATVGADGRPHVVPMTFHFNAAEDTVDLGGVDFAASKKWRDMQINPKATFLVDDASPDGAHAIEIRGDAEIHETGGESIKPAVPELRTAVRQATAAPDRQLGVGERGLPADCSHGVLSRVR